MIDVVVNGESVGSVAALVWLLCAVIPWLAGIWHLVSIFVDTVIDKPIRRYLGVPKDDNEDR